MTTVANIRSYRGDMRLTVLIDRPGAFGNPFRIQHRTRQGQHHGTRAWAIQQFRLYWYHPDQDWLRAAARGGLIDRVLLCHCTPLACHGDVIAEYLNAVCPLLAQHTVSGLTV